MSEAMVVVAIVRSRIEAELIAGNLRESGLRTFISSDDEGGLNLAMQAGRVRIHVSTEDEESARSILEEFGITPKESKEPNRIGKWLWHRLGGQMPEVK